MYARNQWRGQSPGFRENMPPGYSGSRYPSERTPESGVRAQDHRAERGRNSAARPSAGPPVPREVIIAPPPPLPEAECSAPEEAAPCPVPAGGEGGLPAWLSSIRREDLVLLGVALLLLSDPEREGDIGFFVLLLLLIR